MRKELFILTGILKLECLREGGRGREVNFFGDCYCHFLCPYYFTLKHPTNVVSKLCLSSQSIKHHPSHSLSHTHTHTHTRAHKLPFKYFQTIIFCSCDNAGGMFCFLLLSKWQIYTHLLLSLTLGWCPLNPRGWWSDNSITECLYNTLNVAQP